jgi:hypothetical protein
MENDAGKPGLFERVGFALDSVKRSLQDHPCNDLLVKYEKCVEAQTNGLSEGNDCGAEGEEYKRCRKQFRTKTASQGK